MNAMPQTPDLGELVAQGRQVLAAGREAPDWLEPMRDRAGRDLLQMRLPERGDEDWRYTSTDFMREGLYQIAPGQVFSALHRADIEHLLLADDTCRLVFVNGFLVPGLGSALAPDSGLHVTNLAGGGVDVAAFARGRLGTVAAHRHAFAAMNTALMSDGAVVHVAAGGRAPLPVEILHISIELDHPGMVHPRHLLLLEEGARAEVVERYCAIGESRYFNNALVEVELGARSELLHRRVQEESLQARHLSDLHVRQGEGSRYGLVQASLGAAWSRTDLCLAMEGEGAVADIDGLLLAGDRQLTDLHLDVQHRVPSCTSRENVRGIVDGKGRVVFDGRIEVARDAQKSDAALSNDNLLLSRDAEVDTKPQLEIFADDVKCSHGTTVGELDNEMIFYLRSRGVPEVMARQMLCRGFAAQTLDALAGTSLHERILGQLARRLEAPA